MSDGQKVCGMLLHAYYARDPRVQRAAHALRDAGWFVKVICLNEGGETPREEIDGVQVIRCNMSRSRERTRLSYMAEYFGFMMRSLFRLWREDIRQKHDLIVVHNMPNALVFSTLPLRLRRCPVVLDMHDSAPEVFASLFGIKSKFFCKILLLEEKLAMKYASSLITVNRGVEEVFRRRHPWAKFLLVHNSPAGLGDVPAVSVNVAPAEEFRIVFHGNLHERYGLQRLIEVLSRLESAGPVRLDVHGDGPYAKSLTELVEKLGLAGTVTFHGAFKPGELGQILTGKHLGVALYFRDELGDLLLPVKILEYTEAGIPVLASRLETVESYFADDCISYFETSDELVEQVMSIRGNYQVALERAEKARAIAESISWQRDSKRLVEHMESLCNAQ